LLLKLELNANCAHRARKPLHLPLAFFAVEAVEAEVDAVPAHLFLATDKRLERGVGEVFLVLLHGIDCVFDLLFAAILVKSLLRLMRRFTELSPKHL
jgi:hypothetical protein